MSPFPVGTTDESPTTTAIKRAPFTTEVNSATPTVLTTAIRATPTTPNNAVRITPKTVAYKPTSTIPTTRAISPGNTDRPSPTPSGPQTFSTGISNMQLDGVHQYVSQCYCTIYYVYDVVEAYCYSFKCQ